MHPFVLVPLLASFTALYPVGAMPMETNIPIAAPGAGAATLGFILPTNVPNPGLPSNHGALPIRRDLGNGQDVGVKPTPPRPQPVIGFGHDPAVPAATRMTQVRRALLDSPNTSPQRARPPPKAQDLPNDSGSDSLPGLPAGGSTSPLPSDTTSPLSAGSSGSPGLLSSLPVSQAGPAPDSPTEFTPGSTPESPPGFTSDVPNTPAGAEKEVQKESTQAEDGKTENEVAKEPATAEKSETGSGRTAPPNHGASANPNHPSYQHPSPGAPKRPAPVQRRATTSYYHTVNSRGFASPKGHSMVFDTDPLMPPQEPGPDYDPRMGIINVDSNAKPKPITNEESAKAGHFAAGAPKNATELAH